MITKHSIDLTRINEQCFSEVEVHGSTSCRCLKNRHEKCGSYKCPFYKPKDCKDWVRVEDSYGINLVPREEMRGRFR